jgi:diaminopimelate decarboxylase
MLLVMTLKRPLLSLENLRQLQHVVPTPFVIYDEKGIQSQMKQLYNAFSAFERFTNFFALKATPNPTILKLLHNLWSGVDCSSLWELVMSERCGIRWTSIMFTSNNTAPQEFIKAHEMWAIINFDDITHIQFFEDHVGCLPDTASCRYNPWPLKQGNSIIGQTMDAKFGMTREQLFDAYALLHKQWVKNLWIHTMVASNECDAEYFIETATILFDLIDALENELWIRFSFANLWWWLWIPYHSDQHPVALQHLADGVKKAYDRILWHKRSTPLSLAMECGRFITGPCWQLVTTVQHVTQKYKTFVGVDASMHCLMRPGMYGAYHHISVLWKEEDAPTHTYDITWSLCENNDKFGIDRHLPRIQPWDVLVIHDAWAHGTAMWFSYNAKLKPAEYLLQSDGTIHMIRRAETLDDYFAPLVWGDDFFSISNVPSP